MANQGKTSPGLLVLSVLMPIVGFVLYFVKKDDDQEVAKNYLWGAIGGMAFGFIMFF